MSWRNQGITGSNNIPLGARRRFGADSTPTDDGGYNPSQPASGYQDNGVKRGRSPERGKLFLLTSQTSLIHAQLSPLPMASAVARRGTVGETLLRTRLLA